MKGNFMKATILCVIAGLTLSGCEKDGDIGESLLETYNITMTTDETADKATVFLAGSGTAIVDWGDGKSQDVKLASQFAEYGHAHTYAASGSRTITITGIKVTGLKCGSNKLIDLDVSDNIELTSLDCSDNQLYKLDVSNNTALTYLDYSNNKVSYYTVDVEKNTALTHLDCSNNGFTYMNVSTNTALTYLDCSNNYMNYGLNVSKNTALTYLDCSRNRLTDLDVSKNTALTYLDLFYNKLTSLDVSKNTALTHLSCSLNELTSLDVSKNTTLTKLWCHSNQLTVDALNALFGTLHGNTIPNMSKTIWIYYNPGTSGCNTTIATQKGWTFQ